MDGLVCHSRRQTRLWWDRGGKKGRKNKEKNGELEAGDTVVVHHQRKTSFQARDVQEADLFPKGTLPYQLTYFERVMGTAPPVEGIAEGFVRSNPEQGQRSAGKEKLRAREVLWSELLYRVRAAWRQKICLLSKNVRYSKPRWPKGTFTPSQIIPPPKCTSVWEGQRPINPQHVHIYNPALLKSQTWLKEEYP